MYGFDSKEENEMKSKKFLMSLLSVVAISGLASCAPTSTKKSDTGATSTTGKQSTTGSVTPEPEPAKKTELVMSVYYDNKDRHMRFVEGAAAKLPYTSPDGTTYKAGDWKPVWKQLQKDLKFTIDDVSPSQDDSIKNFFAKTLVASGFKIDNKLVNIAQGNSDQIMTEGSSSKGTILDLSKYLDRMPDFKKFLNDNPAVKKIISSSDGKIFYAPYFDGFDDIERMLMVRQDWVEKLLDGDLPSDLDEEVTLDKNYTPFYTTDINSDVSVLNAEQSAKTTIKKHIAANKNIIAQMNAATTLNGKTAVKMLRDYIDEVYGTTYGKKRSELFCGGRAVYDVDELIALFKCVKANPAFLTGNAATKMVALFPRAKTSDRTTDLYRFLQFFGLRGVESRNQWMFVNKDGKLEDVRGTTQFRDGLEKLHQMYQDGLIMTDFTTAQINSKDDYRGPMFSGSYGENSYAGFATYDYNQTTTIYNDSTTDKNALIASLLPAVADYDDGVNGNFIHYTESWRSVKPQGWFITSETAKDEEKLSKCLELFNYLYSEKGNRVMSYGPDEYLAKDKDGKVQTMDYQGKQVAKLSDDTLQQMKTLTGGNYTNYYRYYLGGTFPVGYVKEQGMEYQTVVTKAKPSLDTINKAIQYGVLEHLNHKSDNASKMQDIVPTTLPFTEAENTALSTNFDDLNTAFTSDKKKVMYISEIVINGFGTYNNFDLSKDNYCNTINTTMKLTQFTKYYNDAYTRYLAL